MLILYKSIGNAFFKSLEHSILHLIEMLLIVANQSEYSFDSLNPNQLVKFNDKNFQIELSQMRRVLKNKTNSREMKLELDQTKQIHHRLY